MFSLWSPSFLFSRAFVGEYIMSHVRVGFFLGTVWAFLNPSPTNPPTLPLSW